MASKPEKSSMRLSRRPASQRSIRTDYCASHAEMLQCGIPEDYVDALLDEAYMEELINHTGKLNKRRERRMERYERFHKMFFYFLCILAALGVVIAFWKTLAQPPMIVTGSARLDNVDLSMGLSSADHMNELYDLSKTVTVEFVNYLDKQMGERRESQMAKLNDELEKEEQQVVESTWRKYFPFLTPILPAIRPKDNERVLGGFLRVASFMFNSNMIKTMIPFPEKEVKPHEQIQVAFQQVNKAKDYSGTSQWMSALRSCNGKFKEERKGGGGIAGSKYSRWWCIMMADDQASCSGGESKVADDDEMMGFLDIDDDVRDKAKNGVLPLERSMKKCEDYVKDEMKVEEQMTELKEHDVISVAIMLLVKKGDELSRIQNEQFRNFVTAVTGCEFHVPEGETLFRPEKDTEGCDNFIAGSTSDEIIAKSRAIAEKLKPAFDRNQHKNTQQNPQWLWCLLLCLLMPIYLLWSQIVKCGQRVHRGINRQMGVKKKMIKVTKTLIEKPQEDPSVANFKSQLTELEMAEVQRMSPHVEFGSQVTMRARLKGGYLRSNNEANTADGHGNVFDPNANWAFEAVDPAQSGRKGDAVHAGHPVVIKNSNGDLLSVNETGVAVIPGKGGPGGLLGAIPESGDIGAGQAAPDITTQFVIEPIANEDGPEGAACHLGDYIQVRSLATGGLLRIHKDGHADGVGRSAEPETQFSIDRGGKPISSGTIVALKAHATQEYLHGSHDGNLSADQGGEGWKYWMMERKGDDSAAAGSGSSAENPRGSAGVLGPLKEGDVVTLKGINQKYLEIGADGAGICSNDRDAASIQEFIVERVGMGLKKHDPTIRAGANLCLKPLPRSASSESNLNNYVKINSENGDVTGNGRVFSPDIAFTLEVPDIKEMVDPLDAVLTQGDCTMLLQPLWNKNDIKKCEALSASWTTDEELRTKFKGAVVVANEHGQYTVPKAQGESSQGWIAVVRDNVNIVKAAKQAKAQGATGLIVRCGENMTIKKLSKTSGEEVDLPVVFCDDAAGEVVSERGMILKGTEFKGKHLTEAVRSVADVSNMSGKRTQGAVKNVFDKVGALMVQSEEDRIAAMERGDGDPELDNWTQEVPDDGQGNFKWKVASNTHYLWSKGGGGAGRMDVNFGKKAPPSAHKEMLVDGQGREIRRVADASQNKVYKGPAPMRMSEREPAAQSFRRSMAGMAFMPAEDVRAKRIGSLVGLGRESVTMLDAEDQANQPLQQLPDESDFKIQYEFEELEVAAGESVEDLEDITTIDEEGATVGRFAVPVKRFWLLVLGMLISVLILVVILIYVLHGGKEGAPPSEKGDHDPFKNSRRLYSSTS